MGKESRFQRRLIQDLRRMFPDCIILKNDPTYLQGVPDLLILWKNRWAALECKQNQFAVRGVNQVHYVSVMDKMSFASFIYPENRDRVLHALQYAFKSRGSARLPRPE